MDTSKTKGPDMRRYIMTNYPQLDKVSCRRVNCAWSIEVSSDIVHQTEAEKYKFRKNIFNTCTEKVNPFDKIREFHYYCPDTKAVQERIRVEKLEQEKARLEQEKARLEQEKNKKRKLDEEFGEFRRKIQKKNKPNFEDTILNISEEYEMVKLWKKELTSHLNVILSYPFRNKDVYMDTAKNNIESTTSVSKFAEVRSGDYSQLMPDLMTDIHKQGFLKMKECLHMHDSVVRDPETVKVEDIVKFAKIFILEENEEEELEIIGSSTVEERNAKGFKTAIFVE